MKKTKTSIKIKLQRHFITLSSILLLFTISCNDQKTVCVKMTTTSIGDNQPVILSQLSKLRYEWDEVALIYGYVDDMAMCEEIRDSLGRSDYKCEYQK